MNKATFHVYTIYLLIALLAMLPLLIYGKKELFFFIHKRHHSHLDLLCKNITWIGSGLTYSIVLILLSLARKQKFFFIGGVSYSIVFFIVHQLLKRACYPNALRPFLIFKDHEYLRIIEGVTPVHCFSFPSGHAATVFAMACLLSFFFRNKFATLLLGTLACLVAYSRVYLGFHFYHDIYIGTLIGILSTLFIYFFSAKSAWINDKWIKGSTAQQLRYWLQALKK